MSSISSLNSEVSVVFDAVGTLIFARPTVAEAYFDAASRFGWTGRHADIESRFRSSFSSMSGRELDFATDESLQRLRWRELVGKVFAELETNRVDAIFEHLWDHFAQPTAWEVFPDALDAIELCNERGVPWCIGSNFDARLHQVVAGHSSLATCQRVFCSSQVGFDKPAVEFFREIETSLGVASHQMIMVGDDARLDAWAAEQAGWIGLWLNRDPEIIPADFDAPPQLKSLAELEMWLL
jgi:putative hydrolase of the HAD superfamily